MGAMKAGELSTWRTARIYARGAELRISTSCIRVTAPLVGYKAPTDDVPPGSYTLIKAGLGTLVLSADNGYSGGTLLKAGTLELSAQFAAGFGPAAVGTITFAGSATPRNSPNWFDGGYKGNDPGSQAPLVERRSRTMRR
jgi:autotransporter-associated beta strand protein